MPRTNTEIDHEPASTIASLGKPEIMVATSDVRVERHRVQTDQQIRTVEEILRRCEDRVRRLQATLERSREQLATLEKSHIELKADHENLRKRSEEDRRQRLQLWAGLILLLITFLLNLMRDIVLKPSH